MSEPLSKIPVGMRYYFGAEARLRRSVEDTVMGVFDGWSYEEIATPAVDYLALFERGMGYAQAQRAFRFTDGDGRMLALRLDVTSAVARAAATLFADRPRPLRFCYAAPVFRQQPASHAEWRRENKQLGGELIGAAGNAAEIELLLIVTEIFARLNLNNKYRITLNSVEIFGGICERLALSETQRESMRQLVDQRDTAELQKFLAAFGTTQNECDSFSRLIQLTGKSEILDEARRIITNPRSRTALDNLAALWEIIAALDMENCFEIDFGDVSGLDYYTGLTCKIYVEGAGVRVGSGGRYDDLTANFGRAEPAVGFVLELDPLVEALMRNAPDASVEFAKRTSSAVLNSVPASLFAEARQQRERGERILINFNPGTK